MVGWDGARGVLREVDGATDAVFDRHTLRSSGRRQAVIARNEKARSEN
jgi:hypothetical protein